MIDEKDMGPFADMEPALLEAVSQYGTPPFRKIVQVSVRNVGHYSFDEMPTDIDGWIAWLSAARAEVPAEHMPSLVCNLHWDRGYHDSGDSAELVIWYERPETDDEMRERVGRGIAYVRERAEAERRQYEALAKKFAPDKQA